MIIMGFGVRFGVRRRHRGPPFARGYHQFIIIGDKPERRGKEKVCKLVGSVVSMCPSGFFKKVYGGKRCVFKEERNNGRVEQDRSASETALERAPIEEGTEIDRI